MLHGVEWLGRQYNQLANPAGGPQSATNTISTLAERLTAATSLEDRRAAVLALKGLSRDHTQQVGEKAFSALLTALQQDTQDEETARALVECCVTLCEVVPPPVPEGAKPKVSVA